jgi:hypothetical protein
LFGKKQISNQEDTENFKCYKSTSGISDPSYIGAGGNIVRYEKK